MQYAWAWRRHALPHSRSVARVADIQSLQQPQLLHNWPLSGLAVVLLR